MQRELSCRFVSCKFVSRQSKGCLGSLDLSGGRVLDDLALGEDAAGSVVGIVAGVALAGVVTLVSGLEGAGLERVEGVSADLLNLLGESEGDSLVNLGSVGRGGVLVLLNGSNLGVDGLDALAGDGGLADLLSVALEGAVDEGSGHALDVLGGLCVGEGTVSGGLLEAVSVL